MGGGACMFCIDQPRVYHTMNRIDAFFQSYGVKSLDKILQEEPRVSSSDTVPHLSTYHYFIYGARD